MTTEQKLEKWLQLRWKYYYEWKNLLAFEREARQTIDEFHREQLDSLSVTSWGERAQIIREQVGRLGILRQKSAANRQSLKEREEQERKILKQQLEYEDDALHLHPFEDLSALRQLYK